MVARGQNPNREGRSKESPRSAVLVVCAAHYRWIKDGVQLQKQSEEVAETEDDHDSHQQRGGGSLSAVAGRVVVGVDLVGANVVQGDDTGVSGLERRRQAVGRVGATVFLVSQSRQLVRRRGKLGSISSGVRVSSHGGGGVGSERGLVVQPPELSRASNLAPDSKVEEDQRQDWQDSRDEDFVPISTEDHVALLLHQPRLRVVPQAAVAAVVAVLHVDEVELEEPAKVDGDREAGDDGHVEAGAGLVLQRRADGEVALVGDCEHHHNGGCDGHVAQRPDHVREQQHVPAIYVRSMKLSHLNLN